LTSVAAAACAAPSIPKRFTTPATMITAETIRNLCEFLMENEIELLYSGIKVGDLNDRATYFESPNDYLEYIG
jgi:hypothetical protein